MKALGEKEKEGKAGAQERAKEWDENSPPPPYLREKHDGSGKAKGWDEKLSPFPYSMQVGNQCRRESEGTRRNRWDTLWTEGIRSSQTRRCLGMAHHYHMPGARIRAHLHVGDSPLPQARHGMTQRWNPRPRGPIGLLGRSDGPGKMTNKRPLKDKHLCLLALRVNFIIEPPTLATAGARTSLGGYRECLLV